MEGRIELDFILMEVAKLFAKRSTCGRLHVGAVIAKGSRIISTGYNGPLKGEEHCSSQICDLQSPCTRSIHAEANAIMFASSIGVPVVDGSIYVTTTPCVKCAELIILSGITKVIYSDFHREGEKSLALLRKHNVEVIQF